MFSTNLEEDLGNMLSNKEKQNEVKISEVLLNIKEESSSNIYDHEIESDFNKIGGKSLYLIIF